MTFIYSSLNRYCLAVAILFLFGQMQGQNVSVQSTGGTTSAAYNSINAVFAAINSGTHTGKITISITGNVTEPSIPTTLMPSGTGQSNYSSILIVPSGGNWRVSCTPTVANRGIIELFGVHNVSINGDPANTGIRKLTFASNTGLNFQNSAVIRFASLDNSGNMGACNNSVKNINIIGGFNGTTYNKSAGIRVMGPDLTSNSIAYAYAYGCNNDTFYNNYIVNCQEGITMYGSPYVSSSNKGVIVRKNIIGNINNALMVVTAINAQIFAYTNSMDDALVVDSNDVSANFGSLTNVLIGIQSFNNTAIINANSIHDLNNNGPYESVSGIVASGDSTLDIQVVGNRVVRLSSQMGASGISVGGGNNVIVSENVVDSLEGTINNLFAGCTGINLSMVYAQSEWEVKGNVITRIISKEIATGLNETGNPKTAKLYNNIISGVACVGSGSGATGWHGTAGDIYNNMIGDITATPTLTNPNSSTAVGMYVSGMGNINFNTIALNTENQPSSVNNAFSTAVCMGGDVGSFQNNIVVNNQSSTNAYAIYNLYNQYGNSINSFRYNNYYAAGDNLGYFFGVTYHTLADYQAATQQDSSSIVNLPIFLGTDNLHLDGHSPLGILSNTPLYHAGIAVADITTDIDGDTRYNTPCIGADEIQISSGINNINSMAVRVYPNPASNSIFIDVPNSVNDELYITVTNLEGKNIYYNKIISMGGSIIIPIAMWPSGNYLVGLNKGNNNTTISRQITIINH